jgi:AcrR family transcriptional regulator
VARPRAVSDEEVFAAAHRAMSRLGPGDLRLVDIAEEAGVSASALVQRFGSKRKLLIALSRAWSGSAADFFVELRARNQAPLDVLRDYASCIAGMAASPAAFARNLAYLQIDLTDEDFRETLEAYARSARAEIAGELRAAVDAGELLESADPDRLARTVEAVLSGSLMTWAHYREGDAASWMRADLDAILEPWLAERSFSARPAPPR